MTKFIIAVAGGSGSGKTTFAQQLQTKLGNKISAVLGQDSYYFDQSHRFNEDGGAVNFDHPDALDFELMAEHLKMLKQGQEIRVPIYDFVTHQRSSAHFKFPPFPVVIVDGTLILGQSQLRPYFDMAVFMNTPENVRFERRLHRDVKERGRTPEGVKAQFYKQVKPMHDEFVQTSMTYADLVIGMEDDNSTIISTLVKSLEQQSLSSTSLNEI